MNKKNVLVMVLAMLLVAMISVGGTIAWLTDTTSNVVNTFTVGEIEITLDETDTDNSSATERDTANAYKIIPGEVVAKDPVVTVLANSENCYVYVSVENNLFIEGASVVTLDIDTDNWKLVATENITKMVEDEEVVTGVRNLYVYVNNGTAAAIVELSEEAQPLPAVFATVTVDSNVTKEQLPTLEAQTIVVKAYAHQSDNVTDFANQVEAAAKGVLGF